jgi:hypothetical protein
MTQLTGEAIAADVIAMTEIDWLRRRGRNAGM